MTEAELTEKKGFKLSRIEWAYQFPTLYLHGQNEVKQ